MKLELQKRGFTDDEPDDINPLTGDSFDYTVKWYDRLLSEEEIEVKRQKAKERWLRKQQRATGQQKFKFTPSPAPAENPIVQRIAEELAISETNPLVKYKLACRQLAHYERLCTEYNQSAHGVGSHTNVRSKRDYWQAEVDRLLIEII